MDDFSFPSLEQKEHARWLFSGPCEFLIGATDISHIPDSVLPEVAVIGRSNVGKSSLLNALVGRKDLARTSNTPGRTRQLNFFSLRDQLMLVDLPGYGYAKASRKDAKLWGRMTKEYLQGRVQLVRLLLLIDVRRSMVKVDEDLMNMLDEAAITYQIVLTKIDKVSKAQTAQVVEHIQTLFPSHPALYPQLLATSSTKKLGIDALRYTLMQLVSSNT